MRFLVSIGTMVPACGQTSRPLPPKLGHEAEGSVLSVLPSLPKWCQHVRFAWQTADNTYKAAFTEEIHALLYLYFFNAILSFRFRVMLKANFKFVWCCVQGPRCDPKKSAASCTGDVWKEVVSAPRRAPAADVVPTLKRRFKKL